MLVNLSPDQSQILDMLNIYKIKACMVSFLIKIQSALSSKMVDVFRSELFDKDFHKIVDQNLDLIGFNNGIFNLKTIEIFSKQSVL